MDTIFEEIIGKCNHKNVVSLCKKLEKKLSFKSGKDVEKLCHLIYWLYILENNEMAKKCIDLIHGIEFTQNYNIWTFIHSIQGLEIRILRQEGNNKLADEIIREMDKQLKMPTKIETPEKAKIREYRRRERIDLDFVSNVKKIENCLNDNDIKLANEYRFVALMELIEYIETGFFSKLNQDKKEIENIIKNFIEEIIK